MKCQTIIDTTREEEVVIYVHECHARAKAIARFVSETEAELFGYRENEIKKLIPSEVECFAVRDTKVFAIIGKEEWQMRERLYQLEEILDDRFLKINQSCIANMKKILRFDASFAGSLIVIFSGGYRDYVSRRRLRAVKERMGIK